MITVQSETCKNPISLAGKQAGICWGANTEDNEKNYMRGVDCIKSGHWRTLEYPDVYLVLEGYSARVIRELYTHIGGAPTRLQASTRYIDYKDFDFTTPHTVLQNITAQNIYHQTMQDISKALQQLEELGIPKEDSAMLLPLGMATKVVLKVNLRELIQIFHQRLCMRAYWEFRELMIDIKKALVAYGEEEGAERNEWFYVAKNLFVPKCVHEGFCREKYSCGMMPKKEEN